MKGKKSRENHQWKRVYGPNLDQENANKAKVNKDTQNNEIFKKACEAVGIEPTRRQASKFRRKRGLAFNYGK